MLYGHIEVFTTRFFLSHSRYNVVFMFLTYFLPIGSMTFTYARVGLELWGSQSIGECTQRQLDNIKSKRKVSRGQVWREIRDVHYRNLIYSSVRSGAESFFMSAKFNSIKLKMFCIPTFRRSRPFQRNKLNYSAHEQRNLRREKFMRCSLGQER
jgi:hypothetical protein